MIAGNIDGTLISRNQSAERIYGCTAGETSGRNLSLIVPADDLEKTEEIPRRIRRGQPLNDFESHCVRKYGTIIVINATISPITDKSGNPVGFSSIMPDIIHSNKLPGTDGENYPLFMKEKPPERLSR